MCPQFDWTVMRLESTTLVMLPGLDGTGRLFEPLLKQLPQHIEPLVVKFPTDKPFSLQEHVDFARRLLPAGKPFVLLAESFSGPIALQLLADAPENLVGVIFVATFDRYPKPFLLDLARLLPQRPLLKLFSTSVCCRFFCLGSAPGEAVTLFQQALASVDLKVLSKRLKILAELPPPPESAYTGPCLYLQASHDHLVPKRAAGRLLRHLPQLQIKQLPGPHVILLADPQQGAGIISDFIKAGRKAHA